MPYFNVYEAFNSLDLNDDGMITRNEFKRIIQSRGFFVSEKEANQIVEKMDKNKDGRVSFAEVSQPKGRLLCKCYMMMRKQFISYPCLRNKC